MAFSYRQSQITPMKILHASAACWLGIALGASISSAAELVRINWVGGSGNYSEAANWEGGRVPLDTSEELFAVVLPDAEISVTNDFPSAVRSFALEGPNVRLQVNAPMTVLSVRLKGGIVGGPGPLALEGLSVYDSSRNPGVSVLDGISLSPTSDVLINGTLELRHDLAAGRWSRLVAQGITTFPVPETFEVSYFGSGSLIAIPVTE